MGLKELVDAVRHDWEWGGYWGIAGGALGAYILGNWGFQWFVEEVCPKVKTCTDYQVGLVTAIIAVAGLLVGGALGAGARKVFMGESNQDK